VQCDQNVSIRSICLSADGFCPCRTRHPFAVQDSGESAQKIEFVFSASPETIRREPLEFDPLRSVGYRRDLAACASKNPDVFVLSLVEKVFHAAAVHLNFSAGTKFCFLRSTASM
jgi:hypothetical protein